MKGSVVNGGGGVTGEKVAVEPAQTDGETRPAARRGRHGRRPRSARPHRRLSLHGALAHARRQGNTAQEPEPHLLPDQRRRTRSDSRRGRSRPETGPRLGARLLPRSRAGAAARRHAARNAALRGRGAGRSEQRRTADALALGTSRAEHRLGLERDDHAAAAGGRLRGSRHDLRARRRHSRSPVEVSQRRDRLHLAWRRFDERGRVLGGGERRLHQEHAGPVPGRRQRLRDLGAGRSADARRRHLRHRPVVPRAARRLGRRHRLFQQSAGDDRRGRVRPGAQGAGARPRPRHPTVLALALGR